MIGEVTPDDVLNEIKSQIIGHAKNSARSKQKAIGPSEIAQQCERRIGYRLLDLEKSNFSDPWFTIIGTAMHKWLEDCYKAINKSLPEDRYLIEYRVKIHGAIGGKFDIYDKKTKAIRDWKLVGDSTLKKAKSGGSESYSDQTAQYALGLVAKGYEVEWLEVVYLPRSTYLKNAVITRERFDPERAKAALARHDKVKATTKKHGIKALELLPATESFCHFCPWHLPASPVLEVGCPGAIKPTPNLSTGNSVATEHDMKEGNA